MAVGPDGYYYVGELKGFPGPTGESSIWRVAPELRGPSADRAPTAPKYSKATSIIDLAFGPDGRLYVAELDEASWAAVEIFETVPGGTVNDCDLTTLACEVVASDIPILTSITFDKDGRLWVAKKALILPIAEVSALP